MTNKEKQKIIEDADVIVGGYAFRETAEGNINVFGLEAPNHALLMTANCEILETNMTDIEIEIVNEYWIRNSQFIKEGMHIVKS